MIPGNHGGNMDSSRQPSKTPFVCRSGQKARCSAPAAAGSGCAPSFPAAQARPTPAIIFTLPAFSGIKPLAAILRMAFISVVVRLAAGVPEPAFSA